MAIRKDLDDMLNSLMESSGSTTTKTRTAPRTVRKSKFDDMSVDDLLHALEAEKVHSPAEEPVTESPNNSKSAPAWEFAPPPHDIPVPEPISDETSNEEEVPNIIAEVMHTEASAEATRVFDSIPMNEELPKPTKKKKIVITGELPDYEALRREELEKEKQAKLDAEAAAEEARAAAERQRLEEEAEQRRLALIEEENQRRAEEEARSRRIAEAAERKRKAEEAEQLRLAAEEAERQRVMKEAQAAIDKQRRLDEMKRLAEEAAALRGPKEITFSEETIINSSSADEIDEAIEALGADAETQSDDSELNDDKPKKIGFFKKLIGKGKDEEPQENDIAPEDGLFENNDAPSATDLIDAAIAAINGKADENAETESDPVGNILDTIREDAAEAIADINTPKAEEFAPPSEKEVLSDEDIIAGLTPELKERFNELDADKQQQVIEMRRAQLGAVPPATEFEIEPIEENEIAEDINAEEEITDQAESAEAENIAEKEAEKAPEKADISENVTEPDKPKGKVTSALGRILDEDPDELIAQRREHVEADSTADIARADKKKRLYTVIGVFMSIFAVIGIIATIIKGVGLFHSFTSGEVKKDGFTQMIYPAAIMDIEPFSDPSQLTSEQIITATIWSIIMDEDKISKYEPTLDTVTIPDVDVEKYAVELFGENLPEFEHGTVGPMESRFYYSEGAYNVKMKPITHTYAPEIKSIVKNGNDYTLTVDYYDELPQWMERTVSKQVEFKLTEKEDGTFRFSSMKIISVNSGNL